MKSYEIDNFSLDSNKKHPKIKLMTMNLLITLGILTLATLLAFIFRYVGVHESNIIIAYILGVLFVAKQTEGFIYGIVASIISVLTFNFFFTEPNYSFFTHSPDYVITFVTMLIAALITSTLTTKAKQEARLSFLREKRAKILYRISKSLLRVRSMKEIAEVGAKDIANLLNRSVIIATVHLSETLREPHIYAYNHDERTNVFKSFIEISKMFSTIHSKETSTEGIFDNFAYYVPIKGQSGILGVVGVSCVDNILLSDEHKTLLEAVTTQMALAMERERLSEEQQSSKIEVESEKLKGNLLRAMSHDLRTPLTGILGATATILDHDELLEKEVKRNLLQGVYEDASWLIHSVENILSITRMDEGRIEIKKNMEAVEEVIAEAVSRIKKLTTNHNIKISIPDELIILPMDGILIEQVLINLLDNAVKYTPFHSFIEIKVSIKDDKVIFEVSDT
ncbi:MAG TPA: DUF4118 domain-containing protein, partial [Bacilli bacterium]